MSSTFGPIKAFLDNDIRRVRIPTDISGAMNKLGETFSVDPAFVQIYWRDEDDDLITIKTTDDLSEAIRSGVSRFQIKVEAGITTPILAEAPAPAPAPAPSPAPAPAVVEVAPTPPAPKPDGETKPNVETATSATTSTTTSAATSTPKPTATPQAIHHGVICDMSGMNPLKGIRYQMAGYDYDLCEAEFAKLDDATKANYVVIAHPGAPKVRYSLYQPEAAKPTVAAQAAKVEDPKQKQQAVHHYISCDRSGMNPIKGTRYHLAGVNYDLCEAEFNKLSGEEKAKFVVIARHGDRPVPYGQGGGAVPPATTGTATGAGANASGEGTAEDKGTAEFEQFLQHIFGIDAAPAIQQIKVAFKDVNAQVAKKFTEHKAAKKSKKCGPRKGGGGGCPMRGGKKAGAGCGRRGVRQHGGWHHHHVANASISLGDRLPVGPLGFRSFGPGVAQLQIALIKAGVLDESAIRMYTGKYGPRTAEAVCSLQETHSLGGEPGVFDDKVAAVVLAMIDGTLVDPAPAPEQEVEVTATAPTPTPATVQAQAQAQEHPSHVEAEFASTASAPPNKWQAELDVLAGMGFTDEAVLTPLIEKHNGSIIFVMTELLG